MNESLEILMVTAISLGLFHTAVGPDHYLPFIVLGKAEGWSLRKSLFWTGICGAGHVLSSVILGAIGIAIGWSVAGMEGFEAMRGEFASWGLMSFGAAYLLWGLYRAKTGNGHKHAHVHSDGTLHTHSHDHAPSFEHGADNHKPIEHTESGHEKSHRRTIWALFIVFVLGPCEPLIPLLMVPASKHSIGGIALVTSAFSAATIGTMLTFVTISHYGLKFVRLQPLERYAHALSGAAILFSGLAIMVLGI